MKKQKLKESLKEVLIRGEIWVKFGFAILFISILVVSFFVFDGYQYFYSTTYANAYKGYYFQIHTIDVGKGDCFLIKFPNNECMLIDTGEEIYANTISEYIKQFFHAEKITKIDYLLLTHPDSDHIGGANTILNDFKVETLLRPPVYSYSESQLSSSTRNFIVDDSLTYDETIMTAYDKGMKIEVFSKGMTLNFGDCKAEFLSPKLSTYSNSNNYSAVIMFQQQNKKFLFMGDAQDEIENALIDEYGDYLKADVLKVGHHGSNTSSSQSFLEKVRPSYAILSCPKNSKYFPDKEVSQRLQAVGTEIISTAKNGNFVMTIKNNSIVFSKSYRPINYAAIIFSVLLIVSLILFKLTFKNKGSIFIKK